MCTSLDKYFNSKFFRIKRKSVKSRLFKSYQKICMYDVLYKTKCIYDV